MISHELQLVARASNSPHLQQRKVSKSDLDHVGAAGVDVLDECASMNEDASGRDCRLGGVGQVAQMQYRCLDGFSLRRWAEEGELCCCRVESRIVV